MKEKQSFDAAIERGEHLLRLYELLHDTRQRKVRSDWAGRFKEIMHWPSNEEIVRVDGKKGNSILILRESLEIDRKHFSHEYLSELLRGVVVTAVSAFDRYIHDLIVQRCWSLISRAEENIPADLAKLRLPLLATRKALAKLRSDPKSRPGLLIKAAVQEMLHRDYTFQKPDLVEQAMRMLGITDFWSKIAKEMPGTPSPGQVKDRLRQVVDRRNQIVHEADVVRKTRAKQVIIRPITEPEAKQTLEWIKGFAGAVDRIVK
jgi:hypothetical protein